MLLVYFNRYTQTRKRLQVSAILIFNRDRRTYGFCSEFDGKRQNAVSTNERLQQEAQAVLDVIENPDVAQALRQDKNQNLQYLKDNYNVCSSSSILQFYTNTLC